MLQRIQRHIDQDILNESKTRQNTLAMAWIDNKKAYDMVPQSSIINCLKMYKISDEVINFIEKTMKTWRVELTSGGKSLTEAKIQRSIFQEDALSPLLFIIAMMPLNHILGKCTDTNLVNRRKTSITQYTSSSCRAVSTNIPDPLSPLLPIIHRLWQVFRVTSCVLT